MSDAAAQPMPASDVPAVLDIEASGFGAHSYPIEIGYVLPDGATYCSLIRPEADWVHWDPDAEKIHGISPQSLRTHGRAVRDVAAQLNQRLEGRTLYSDGWLHDYTWLAALFEAAEQRPRFRLEDIRALLTEQQANRWHEVKEQVSEEMDLQRHRASTDARVLQQTLIRVRGAAATAI